MAPNSHTDVVFVPCLSLTAGLSDEPGLNTEFSYEYRLGRYSRRCLALPWRFWVDCAGLGRSWKTFLGSEGAAKSFRERFGQGHGSQRTGSPETWQTVGIGLNGHECSIGNTGGQVGYWEINAREVADLGRLGTPLTLTRLRHIVTGEPFTNSSEHFPQIRRVFHLILASKPITTILFNSPELITLSPPYALLSPSTPSSSLFPCSAHMTASATCSCNCDCTDIIRRANMNPSAVLLAHSRTTATVQRS